MNALKKNAVRASALALSLVASASAFAQTATPDQGVDAITALSDKATTYIGAAFTVAVLVAGGFWGIKMMKKAFSKAG